MDDADLRAEFGVRSRKFAEDTFSVEQVGKQLTKVLEQVFQHK